MFLVALAALVVIILGAASLLGRAADTAGTTVPGAATSGRGADGPSGSGRARKAQPARPTEDTARKPHGKRTGGRSAKTDQERHDAKEARIGYECPKD